MNSCKHPPFFAIFTIELRLLQAWPLNFCCKYHGNWVIKAVSCPLHIQISAGLCFEFERSRLDLSWKRYFMPSLIATFEICTFYFNLFSRFINRRLGRVSSISPSWFILYPTIMICGCLVVQRYLNAVVLFIFSRYSMKSRYFRPVNRSKFCPRMEKVVLACSKKEKQEIEKTSPALLHVYQTLFVHRI